MALLIDADLLIDLELGVGTPAVERLLGDEERAISVITVSELLHGALRRERGWCHTPFRSTTTEAADRAAAVKRPGAGL